MTSYGAKSTLSLQWRVPWWIVAVSTMRRRSVRWVDPNVNWLHIRIDPLSQVECGRPQGLLQWLGDRSDASVTRWWSCWKSARVTCPKKRSRLSWIRWETGQQPVVNLAGSLVTCLVYGIRRVQTNNYCAPVGVWSVVISLSVCLSVCLSIFPHIAKIFCRPICYLWHGSFLLWRQFSTLCTSGYVDDVMFSYNGANGPESKTTRMFQRVRQVAAPEAKLLSRIAVLFMN